MAVDIVTVRSGIGIRVRPSSLFCKELSLRYHFHENLPRAWPILDSPPLGPADARFSARYEAMLTCAAQPKRNSL